jgi:hypothetical protein
VVRPQALRSGTLSAAGLRFWIIFLSAVAVLRRLAVHFSSGSEVPVAPAPLADYLGSPEWVWSFPPLPGLILGLAHASGRPGTVLLGIELLAVITVVVLTVRLGQRWLDYRVGLLAAGAWAFCGPAVAVFRVPGSEGWQAALSVLCAAAMLRVARRRAPAEAWRIGVAAGALSLFSGGGLAWAVAAVVWLPATSRRFRGRAWLLATTMLLTGWAAVVVPVAARNAVLTGGDPILPLAQDAARFHSAMVHPQLDAGSAATLPGPPPGVSGDGGRDPEWFRSLRLSVEALASGPQGWSVMMRRGLALVGGWLPHESVPAWVLPWPVVAVLGWAGIVALVPGTRFLFPLLFGGLIALLRGMLYGVEPGVVLAATPFVCLYAANGVWRAATGWRSPITWIVLPSVLLAATALHLLVRTWS